MMEQQNKIVVYRAQNNEMRSKHRRETVENKSVSMRQRTNSINIIDEWIIFGNQLILSKCKYFILFHQ